VQLNMTCFKILNLLCLTPLIYLVESQKPHSIDLIQKMQV